jgi:hypothetical protein
MTPTPLPASLIQPNRAAFFTTNYSKKRATFTRFLALFGVVLFSAATHAADPQTPQARYQADRAACLTNNPNIDRAACLREAGAALQESKKSGSVKSSGPHNKEDFARNRTLRCQPLPSPDREDCLRRMQGEGVVEGSVEAGGVLRTLERPVAAPSPTQ